MNQISFTYSSLKDKAKERPDGYLEHVLSYADVVAGRVFIDASDLDYLTKYYNGQQLLEPKLIDQAANLTKALSKWAKSGFKVADKDTIEDRKSNCESCEFWKHNGNMGLGKCNHAECGCTKVKWWLATEKCPIDKW